LNSAVSVLILREAKLLTRPFGPAFLMEVTMKSLNRMFLGLCVLATAGWTPVALADSGSDMFNAEVAQVQQQIMIRNQLADDLVRSQLALGYSVPEVLGQSRTMYAEADDDAFTRAMNNLHKTMSMYALLD
jgi:hypothetical protein